MRSARLSAVMAVLIVASMFQPAAAHMGTLDQQQALICSSEVLSQLQFLGQTFKAGLNGPLTEVDLVIGCSSTDGGATPCASNGPVTVEIHSDSTIGDLLGSSSLPGSAIPEFDPSGLPSVFVTFTFSPPPTVVAGSVYAIVITTTEWVHAYSVGDCNTNPYFSRGSEWINGRTGGQGWQEHPDSDFAFKTYVAAAAPPVGGVMMPVSTLAMVAPWLALIGLVGCIGTAVVAKKRKTI